MLPLDSGSEYNYVGQGVAEDLDKYDTFVMREEPSRFET